MRRFLFELVLLGIALGLTVEVIKSAVPFLPLIWFVILVHYTWEGITYQPVLSSFRQRKNGLSGKGRMYSYGIVAILGAGLLVFYWWGLNSFFAPKIATYEAEQGSQGRKNNGSTDEISPKVEPKPESPTAELIPKTSPPLAVHPAPASSNPPAPTIVKPTTSAPGASTSDNVTEGIWFGITIEASSTIREEFESLSPKFLDQYKKNGSLNTVDQLPVEFYDTAWESTFGKILICGDEGILSSAMSFILSQHPLMLVSIANTASPGKGCAKRATVSAPYMGDGVILTGIGSWPHQSYILDFPFWGEKNTFALRFHMWGGELKQLNQGYSPPWKSFAIDDANEKIQLEIVRKGATWIPIPRLDECLPKKITLRTGLESGGPWIVREYKLTSTVPRQIAHSSEASQIFTWAFTWQRSGYAEQPNSFASVDGILPAGPVVFQDGRN